MSFANTTMSKFLATSSLLLFVFYLTLPTFINYTNKLLIELSTDHNPDYLATTCELAESRGYDCVTHSVTTHDGYIIDIQRVTNTSALVSPGTSTPVALLMHGFECDSTIWVQNFQNQSLGYILADEGVDVWLGNVRGNFYGERHQKYDSNVDYQFWQFSFQQMAQYDLPAIVNYVIDTTGRQKIFYVGHSQGTLMAFLQMSEDLTLQDKIETAFMLTPVYSLTSMKSPLKYLLQAAYNAGKYLPSIRLGPTPPIDLVIWAYTYPLPSAYVIEYIWQSFSGNSDQTLHRNNSQMKAYLAHGLAGTSVQNVRHFAQVYIEQKQAKFDFHDSKINMLHYNSTKPPLYNIERINRRDKSTANRTKFAMFWGDKDWLVTEDDRRKLLEKLKDVTFFSKVCENFSHLDFIWGLRANECAYFKIRDIISSSQHMQKTL
ncbi:lysosomal acid lipase/cholesteryl ester hydrolase-like [Convolutriloba macropyga]|uniref:lysosomal acid lipase/cholesteryl ester hydrolase-like n=1 Tax=Convolutriloba macropyga TaxID=536237 RepID=UPI003F526DD4